MKLSPAEQAQLTELLARLYFDILAIETRFELLVGGGDQRPRIDYFHDAVRALTSKAPIANNGNSRLNIEWLAYDVSALRYVQSMPLASLDPMPGSPSTTLTVRKPGALAATPKRADRQTKESLTELYELYAILFSALFKPFADNDFRERTDAAHQDIQNLHALISEMEAGAKGAAISDTIAHLDDERIRAALQKFFASGKQKKKAETQKLLGSLKQEIKTKNKTIKNVEKAHMDYGLAQLGIYESGKDAVKKMAAKGMNLAGKFVESAMAETRREMGR